LNSKQWQTQTISSNLNDPYILIIDTHPIQKDSLQMSK
jgi:hypothetical protein